MASTNVHCMTALPLIYITIVTAAEVMQKYQCNRQKYFNVYRVFFSQFELLFHFYFTMLKYHFNKTMQEMYDDHDYIHKRYQGNY